MRVAEQMRAFPSGDWPGKFSVTHVLPRALNRSIVLRNHKHAGTVPAQPHPSWVPAAAQPPRSPEGSALGRRAAASPEAAASSGAGLAALAAQGTQSSQPATSDRLSFPWHPGKRAQCPGSRAYVCSLSKQVGGKGAKRSLLAAPLCQHHTSPRAEYTVYFPSH